MEVVNYTRTRDNLAKIIDNVVDNNETVVITKNDKTVVMISLDEFNSWKETSHLLKSKKNAERLMESIKNIEAAKFEAKELINEND